MCSNRLWHSQYAHQKVVATFCDLVYHYKELELTYISQNLVYSANVEGCLYEVRSVRNGSKFSVRFRFWFHPEQDHCEGFYHSKNPDHCNWASFATNHPACQLHNFRSNWESEFWSYRDMFNTQIVKVSPQFHLPLSNWRSDQYSLSCYPTPSNFAENWELFHSDSTSIGWIANRKAGGETAANTAQSTYWSYHDTIRTQQLNLSQSSVKSLWTIKLNCGPVATWPNTCRFLSGPGNNWALVTQVGILGGSRPGPGASDRFQPRPQPDIHDPMLTLDVWRYITTGLLPYEQFSRDWPLVGQHEW